MISRRNLFKLVTLTKLEVLTQGQLARAKVSDDWRDLLVFYKISTRSNIVELEGRRALLSSRIYPDGAHWPMHSIVALALAYACGGRRKYADWIIQLIVNELALDHQSKELIRLTPGAVGTVDPSRSDYTWNALIRTACVSSQKLAVRA